MKHYLNACLIVIKDMMCWIAGDLSLENGGDLALDNKNVPVVNL